MRSTRCGLRARESPGWGRVVGAPTPHSPQAPACAQIEKSIIFPKRTLSAQTFVIQGGGGRLVRYVRVCEQACGAWRSVSCVCGGDSRVVFRLLNVCHALSVRTHMLPSDIFVPPKRSFQIFWVVTVNSTAHSIPSQMFILSNGCQ